MPMFNTDTLRTLAGTAAMLMTVAHAAGETRDVAMFEAWRVANAESVAAYEAFLRAEGLDALAPLHTLLRSASSWQDCAAEPFAVPPAEQWPAVLSVLSLLRRLREAGVLQPFEVHSTYRDAALNACAGGARRSAHLVSYAVDFTVPEQSDAGSRLCVFWREQGQALRMGLSRYPSGRIHVDTSGWRSWGADGTWRSSFCRTAEEAEAAPR
jgi:uncharacterized protein YcbK (DUF882 family)